jgi:hypothetical protein
VNFPGFPSFLSTDIFEVRTKKTGIVLDYCVCVLL